MKTSWGVSIIVLQNQTIFWLLVGNNSMENSLEQMLTGSMAMSLSSIFANCKQFTMYI